MKNDKRSSLSSHAILISSIVVPLLILLALDSFGNSEKVYKLIGIQSNDFVVPCLFLFLILRCKWEVSLHSAVKLLLGFILSTGLLATTFLTVYGAHTPANSAFALTRLNQDNLWLLTITAGIIFFLNKSNAWWQQHWKRVLFSTPFIFFYIAVITRLFPFDVFMQLVKEDHFIENSQFLVLALGSVLSFISAFQFKKRPEFLFISIFILSGLVFFFVAMDEISWGQRILGIEVNEGIKQLNRQNELTIHNLYTFEWLVTYGYFAFSTFGVFGRFICKRVSFLNKFTIFTPRYLLWGYFVFPFIFYFMQLIVEHGIWHPWAEVAELYFYSGIVLWVLLFGLSLRNFPSKITWRKLLTKS